MPVSAYDIWINGIAHDSAPLSALPGPYGSVRDDAGVTHTTAYRRGDGDLRVFVQCSMLSFWGGLVDEGTVTCLNCLAMMPGEIAWRCPF